MDNTEQETTQEVIGRKQSSSLMNERNGDGDVQVMNEDDTEDEEVKRSCFGKRFYSTTSCSEDDMTETDEDEEDEGEDADSDSEDDGELSVKGGDKYQEYDSSTIGTCSDADSEGQSDEEDNERIGRLQPKKFTFDLQECEPGKIVKPTPVTLEKFRAMAMNGWDDEEEEEESDEDVIEDDEDPDDYDDESNEGDASNEEDSDLEAEEDSDGGDVAEAMVMDKIEGKSDAGLNEEDDESTLKVTFDEISVQDSPDDEEDEVESQVDDENDCLSSYCSAAPNDSVSEADLENDGSDDELSLSSSLSGEESLLFTLDQCDDDDESEEEEEEGAKMKVQDSIKNEEEENESGFDGIEYVNNIAICGPHDDNSSESVQDLESIMDKVQKEDTFYESTSTESELETNGVVAQTLDQKNNEDNGDSILCQVLKHKQGYDEESEIPSKKRRRTIEISCLPFASCKVLNRGEMTPYPEENEFKGDWQLAEELLASVTPNSVPILTPPASPMQFKSDESIVDIYERPCNLSVENGLAPAIQLRSLSPSSLAKLDDDDQNKSFAFSLHPRKLRSVTKDFTNSPVGNGENLNFEPKQSQNA